MSYKEIKIIGGRKYLYERTSYRLGNIVRHKSKYIKPFENKAKKK